VADRAAFQAGLERLRAREKAHTREGDAIAAAFRWSRSIRARRCSIAGRHFGILVSYLRH
jgi:hypothetical protein